jgi:hypothetical protein
MPENNGELRWRRMRIVHNETCSPCERVVGDSLPVDGAGSCRPANGLNLGSLWQFERADHSVWLLCNPAVHLGASQHN